MEERNAARQTARPGMASAIVCSQASRPWRREVGALAWVALEELALTATQDDRGWASPARIHAIATGIGTTDAAALRAIAALGKAGLVVLEPVTDEQGCRRCGYRLYLPDGIELRDCPVDEDAAEGVPGRGEKDRDGGLPDRNDHGRLCQDGHGFPAEHQRLPVDRSVRDHYSAVHGAEGHR